MRKILIIRFSSIGDIILTTPVIRCLKQQTGNCEVHYLTKEQFRPMLADNPFIDKIFTIREKISEIIPDLKKENYDHVVDLHKNFRSLGVRIQLRRPSTSFPKINFKKWLLVNFKINLLPDVHIVDRYFKAVESLNIKNDGKGLDYFIPAEDEITDADLPSTHRDGYIGFVIGGKHATKQLSPEKIINLCKKINKPVILLGGPDDASLSEKVRVGVGDKIFNACGGFSLNQSASLVKHAEKIITNDTGLMHIAAAFKKEIISVWGNTVPEFGMYPYFPGNENRSVIIEVKGLSCRPCSKIGYDKCPKGHFNCIEKIDENAILSHILRVEGLNC